MEHTTINSRFTKVYSHFKHSNKESQLVDNAANHSRFLMAAIQMQQKSVQLIEMNAVMQVHFFILKNIEYRTIMINNAFIPSSVSWRLKMPARLFVQY